MGIVERFLWVVSLQFFWEWERVFGYTGNVPQTINIDGKALKAFRYSVWQNRRTGERRYVIE